MKTAIRRHHRERVLSKRMTACAWLHRIDADKRGMYIDTPHPCSCRGRGNQRFWKGPTVQERRQPAWMETV